SSSQFAREQLELRPELRGDRVEHHVALIGLACVRARYCAPQSGNLVVQADGVVEGILTTPILCLVNGLLDRIERGKEPVRRGGKRLWRLRPPLVDLVVHVADGTDGIVCGAQ